MNRKYLDILIAWKAEEIRKPIVLMGARQVGKTFLLKDFAQSRYTKVHYFNFEKTPSYDPIFAQSQDPKVIIKLLGQVTGQNISPETDLIIFDEIQACPAALSSLKYFAEEMPRAHLAAAGSLLGLYFSESSFPVGKVQILKIYPMDFVEFLKALNQSDLLASYLISPNLSLHEILWQRFIDYLIVGGLPEVVNHYVNSQNVSSKFEEVRNLQEQLILGYLADMAKHCGKENAMFLDRIWKNSAEQLGQEKSQKFQFTGVFPGKRSYQDFASPIDWLKKAGLIYQIHLIDSVKVPLSVQRKENSFKLYIFDVGILNALSGLSPQQIINYDFSHKGFIAESFFLQELISNNCQPHQIYTYRSGTSEIEFLTDWHGLIIPLEVKAGHNLKAKSLSSYILKNKPTTAHRYSRKLLDLERSKKSTVIKDWPLFAVAPSLS